MNLYGSDKGVDDASLVTGIVWYNPWTTTVCEDYTHVFSLRGDSIVTRGLLKVKNLLCKRV
ncbi:hypothetical protein [Fusobacterium sp.]|uniref:hypothetical protein n=1 Tax=Fusobacterium sp. TaxID=68766 RepID=UPI002E7A8ABF|nr:hypothetical protein [Fusobacterium sp.]MEE1476346.1 hypothetical protein [Fusobacterium sp.]